MQIILLTFHVIIAIFLILMILAQRSNSDGLSGLASGSNNSGLVSGRAAANILTTITYTLAGCFMITSLLLANLANKSKTEESIIDEIVNIDNSKILDKSSEVPIAE